MARSSERPANVPALDIGEDVVTDVYAGNEEDINEALDDARDEEPE